MVPIKKIAILGANGFLGQNTIKMAIKEDWSVVGIIRREEVLKEIESLGALPIIVKNFNTDDLMKAFQGCQSIIHFANVVCGSKEIFKKVNIEGTKNIVEAATKAGVKRIIYPSGLGIEEYSKKDWATNNYFWSKREAERIIQSGEVSFVIFRPSYILGPNDELIPELIKQIYDTKVLVAGEGNKPMQPIFVEDAARAFLSAADGMGEDNKIYHLVGLKVITMLELIDLLHKHMIKLGFNVPPPVIEKIPFDSATERLDLCEEMVDIMKSDIIVDSSITAKALGITLSPLEKAINAAIIEKLSPKYTIPKKSAIILLSGGIDSATAFTWAIEEGYYLIALSFNYRYRPEREKNAVIQLTRKHGTHLIEIPMPFIQDVIDLRFEGYPIPNVIDAPQGYIPIRNLIFYSIATYYAEAFGITTIIGGHLASDMEKFSDASSIFFTKLEEIMEFSRYEKEKTYIKFLLPLAKMSKLEVLKLAKKLYVPFEFTWSCNNDSDKPCGMCSSCMERKKAFNEAGLSDPLFSH